MSEIMKSTADSPAERTLYLAFELGNSDWKLGFSPGLGQAARQRQVQAGDLVGLAAEIRRAKERFKLAETVRVVSCYEAGRDGFWLHRYLVKQGVDNRVVDSASIEVNRRAKRAKTDQLDVQKLLTMLIRSDNGEPKVWSVVHVPSVEAEDSRHLHRQLSAFKADRTRHSNRLKGMLVGQGVRLPVEADFLERIEQVRLWDGRVLPPGLQARLKREFAGYQFMSQQVQELEAERRQLLRNSTEPSVEQVRRLLQLRGLGENSAWLFVMEFFSWREFRTRRQVGGLAGLTPTPYQSSEQSREQGIDKAGNSPIRTYGGHRDCLGLAQTSTRQRIEPVVPKTLWAGQQTAAQDRHCGFGSQIADCPVALSGLWRNAGRRPTQIGLTLTSSRT